MNVPGSALASMPDIRGGMRTLVSVLDIAHDSALSTPPVASDVFATSRRRARHRICQRLRRGAKRYPFTETQDLRSLLLCRGDFEFAPV